MTWRIDPSRSLVEFAVRHMMFTTVRGRFTEFAGVVLYDAQEPVLSSVEARIAVASLTTGDHERDAAVLSPDFLDAARYPEITFASRGIRPAAPDRGRITGDLTIHDVTQRVALDTRRLERTASSARIAATTTLSPRGVGPQVGSHAGSRRPAGGR